MYRDLDAESLTTLASHTTLVYSAQDKNLCVSGDRYEVDDPADSVYMLMAGSVKVGPFLSNACASCTVTCVCMCL